MNTPIGLDKETFNKLKQVISSHTEITDVILYGSRAKGDYRPGSDIDLTLKGNKLTLSVLNSIEHELDELNLPYSIDLSIYDQIDNHELIDHINRVGQSLLTN